MQVCWSVLVDQCRPSSLCLTLELFDKTHINGDVEQRKSFHTSWADRQILPKYRSNRLKPLHYINREEKKRTLLLITITMSPLRAFVTCMPFQGQSNAQNASHTTTKNKTSTLSKMSTCAPAHTRWVQRPTRAQRPQTVNHHLSSRWWWSQSPQHAW